MGAAQAWRRKAMGGWGVLRADFCLAKPRGRRRAPLGAARISVRIPSQHQLFRKGTVPGLGTLPSAAPEGWEF